MRLLLAILEVLYACFYVSIIGYMTYASLQLSIYTRLATAIMAFVLLIRLALEMIRETPP